MTLLYALGGKGAKRREILGKPDGRHDLGQLRGGFNAQQAHIQRRRRIGLQRPAHGAHLDRHLDAAAEVAFLVGPPLGERRVAVAAGRESMRPGFDGTPIVSGGNGHGIDAVHDPLVVGGCPVGVHRREVRGNDDPVAHLLSAVVVPTQRRVRNRALGAGKRAVREVGENPQKNLPAGDGLDQRGDAFAHPVGEIGAHGVTGIHEQVDNQGRLAARTQRMCMQFDIPGTAAAGNHFRMKAVGQVEDFLSAFDQRGFCRLDIGEIDDLDLTDQDGVGRLGDEAAVLADQL